jgi:hypothetical protein
MGISGSDSDYLTIRRIDNDVSLIELGKSTFVAYRPDEPPAWVPTSGLAEDVRLLCRELETVKQPLSGGTSYDAAFAAAFERAGRGARSELMHTIMAAVASAYLPYRAALLEKGLHDAGEPIPACPGFDSLRQFAERERQARPEVDD